VGGFVGGFVGPEPQTWTSVRLFHTPRSSSSSSGMYPWPTYRIFVVVTSVMSNVCSPVVEPLLVPSYTVFQPLPLDTCSSKSLRRSSPL
jgi:hypothetical protein